MTRDAWQHLSDSLAGTKVINQQTIASSLMMKDIKLSQTNQSKAFVLEFMMASLKGSCLKGRGMRSHRNADKHTYTHTQPHTHSLVHRQLNHNPIYLFHGVIKHWPHKS